METQSLEIWSVVVFLLTKDPRPPPGRLLPFKAGPQWPPRRGCWRLGRVSLWINVNPLQLGAQPGLGFPLNLPLVPQGPRGGPPVKAADGAGRLFWGVCQNSQPGSQFLWCLLRSQGAHRSISVPSPLANCHTHWSKEKQPSGLCVASEVLASPMEPQALFFVTPLITGSIWLPPLLPGREMLSGRGSFSLALKFGAKGMGKQGPNGQGSNCTIDELKGAWLPTQEPQGNGTKQTGWDLRPETWDPLLLYLYLDTRLLEQPNTKKLWGTKNNCVHEQWGQIYLGPQDIKRPKTQLPFLKSWEQKSRMLGVKEEYWTCPLHSTPPKEWANQLSHSSGLTPRHTWCKESACPHSGSKQRKLLFVFAPSCCNRDPNKVFPQFLVWLFINFCGLRRPEALVSDNTTCSRFL